MPFKNEKIHEKKKKQFIFIHMNCIRPTKDRKEYGVGGEMYQAVSRNKKGLRSGLCF